MQCAMTAEAYRVFRKNHIKNMSPCSLDSSEPGSIGKSSKIFARSLIIEVLPDAGPLGVRSRSFQVYVFNIVGVRGPAHRPRLGANNQRQETCRWRLQGQESKEIFIQGILDRDGVLVDDIGTPREFSGTKNYSPSPLRIEWILIPPGPLDRSLRKPWRASPDLGI